MADERTAATTESRPEILDACCGGRMWWWDKEHPLAAYMDDRSVGQQGRHVLPVNPGWECRPSVAGDFRAMPFPDVTFQLVLFDPPHIVRPNPSGRVVMQYGALHPDTEQEDLRCGFAECWRVLRPGGTLVFKWSAGSIKRVEPHFPAVPIVGTRSPRGGQTRWFIFYKPLDASQAENLQVENERLRDALDRTGSLFSPLEHLQWEQIKALETEVAELRASGCARPLSAERDGAVNAKDNPPATGEGAL